MRSVIVLLAITMFLVSCGESRSDREERERIQQEEAEVRAWRAERHRLEMEDPDSDLRKEQERQARLAEYWAERAERPPTYRAPQLPEERYDEAYEAARTHLRIRFGSAIGFFEFPDSPTKIEHEWSGEYEGYTRIDSWLQHREFGIARFSVWLKIKDMETTAIGRSHVQNTSWEIKAVQFFD